MPPFDNPKVREAIAWAVDRDNLVKLQGGQAQALYQFYPPGMPGHVEGKEYYGYDPEKAKALLAEAGFPDGFETMLYTDNVDPNPKLMQSVQADLKAIGIEADLKTMSNDTFYNQQSTPNTLTMGSFSWWMDFPDPSDWIGPLFSKASAVPGGMNSSFWWSQELEDAYVAAQAMTDPKARIDAYSAMQDIIAADTAYAPLYLADPDDDVLEERRRVLPAPGVPDRPGELLETVGMRGRRRQARRPRVQGNRPFGGRTKGDRDETKTDLGGAAGRAARRRAGPRARRLRRGRGRRHRRRHRQRRARPGRHAERDLPGRADRARPGDRLGAHVVGHRAADRTRPSSPTRARPVRPAPSSSRRSPPRSPRPRTAASARTARSTPST